MAVGWKWWLLVNLSIMCLWFTETENTESQTTSEQNEQKSGGGEVLKETEDRVSGEATSESKTESTDNANGSSEVANKDVAMDTETGSQPDGADVAEQPESSNKRKRDSAPE